MSQLVGRKGLARILDVAEATTRNLEAAGEIAPAMIVDGRSLFTVEDANALKARRDARRQSRPMSEPKAAA
jgi:hypothetical protein